MVGLEHARLMRFRQFDINIVYVNNTILVFEVKTVIDAE